MTPAPKSRRCDKPVRRQKAAGIALVLAIAFFPAAVWWGERHSEASPSNPETSGAPRRHASADGASDRAEARARGSRPRKTLRNNLPDGAEIRENDDGSGIVVSWPNGTTLGAAAAAVTESGISFKGPYRVASQDGSSISSEEEDYNLYISQDGTRMKTGTDSGNPGKPVSE